MLVTICFKCLSVASDIYIQFKVLLRKREKHGKATIIVGTKAMSKTASTIIFCGRMHYSTRRNVPLQKSTSTSMTYNLQTLFTTRILKFWLPSVFWFYIAVDSAPVMSPFGWQGKLRQGLDSCELMLGSSDLKLETAAGQGAVILCSPCKITPLSSKGKNSSIPDSVHLSILHRILELHRKSV